MAYGQIIRFQTVVIDESIGQTIKFSRSYGIDEGVPAVDLVGTNLLNAASKYWDTIKGALLPIMHSQQFVSQIVADVWGDETGSPPLNASPVMFTPVDGVVGAMSILAGNYGAASAYINYRLGLKFGGVHQETGILAWTNPVRKAASWRVPCSVQMFDNHGYMNDYTKRALAVSLAAAFQSTFDVDEVPLVSLPGFTATPVCTSFVYDDELIGGDPDLTNNLLLRAYWEGQGCSFSSLKRAKRTSQPEAWYGA